MNMTFDRDLASVQEARNLIKTAKTVQKEYEKADQATVDNLVAHLSQKLYKHAEMLAQMAVEETGFGNITDKTFKNQYASKNVYEAIKDMKTRGVINVDEDKQIWEVGVAVGVVVGLIPSTNPTSTTIFKTLASLKSGNALVLSPHPSAIKCITKTVELLKEGIRECGLNEDLVNVQSVTSIEGTNTLMKHPDTGMILATGGSAMVKVAYSSGNPALGVGPGNVPAFIERSADIPKAVAMIIAGKTFDNGVVCASEESVVVEKVIAQQVEEEFKKQGCYFLDEQEKKLVEGIIQNCNGGINSKIVGKTPQQLAKMAGIWLPDDVKILIAKETNVGQKYPFSMEKLSTMMAFYVEEDWKSACAKCIEILNYDGLGHSLAIHSQNIDVIREFAIEKPVSRMMVNTPATHGALGITTSLVPSLTLGCGSIGGSATSENVTPMHLINIRKVAFGLPAFEADYLPSKANTTKNVTNKSQTSEEIVAKIVREVLEKLK